MTTCTIQTGTKMYINKNKSRFRQWLGYCLGNALFLSAGTYGYSTNTKWAIGVFYFGVGIQLLQALLYGLTVLWCSEEDKYKVAITLAMNGLYKHEWLELVVDGLFILLMLFYLHWLIATAYLISAIIMARVKYEIKFVEHAAQAQLS